MATAEEDLITQAEAARLRGVTRSAIQYLITQGRIQTFERYGMRLVSRREVMDYEPLKPGPAPKAKANGAVKEFSASGRTPDRAGERAKKGKK